MTCPWMVLTRTLLCPHSEVNLDTTHKDVVGVADLHGRDGVVVPLSRSNVVLVVGGHGNRPAHAVRGGGVVTTAFMTMLVEGLDIRVQMLCS